MKTIITLLTATVLVAGATSAMAADRQASDEAANNNLSWQAARGYSGGAFASARVHSGARAMVRVPSGARAMVRIPVETRGGFAPGGIDFQAQGAGN
jgi:hypothetical protein